jgi:hypothetical protein
MHNSSHSYAQKTNSGFWSCILPPLHLKLHLLMSSSRLQPCSCCQMINTSSLQFKYRHMKDNLCTKLEFLSAIIFLALDIRFRGQHYLLQNVFLQYAQFRTEKDTTTAGAKYTTRQWGWHTTRVKQVAIRMPGMMTDDTLSRGPFKWVNLWIAWNCFCLLNTTSGAPISCAISASNNSQI